jgi:HJR/Mrr/RecB family endonuclease
MRKSIFNLTIKFFKRRGYQIKEGEKTAFKKVDLLITKGKEVHLVWIKDWNRTVGVNVMINMDKASKKAGYLNPIVVAEKFSDHAKAYAYRKGIRMITRSEIMFNIKR